MYNSFFCCGSHRGGFSGLWLSWENSPDGMVKQHSVLPCQHLDFIFDWCISRNLDDQLDRPSDDLLWLQVLNPTIFYLQLCFVSGISPISTGSKLDDRGYCVE